MILIAFFIKDGTVELLMSQVIQQEALTRLLVENGRFSKEEFLEIVRVRGKDMGKAKQRWV